MSDYPTKPPEGFSIERYSANLHKYFPPEWGGTPWELKPAPPAEDDRDRVRGDAALCELLGLTLPQLMRAKRLGMPFEQDENRRYNYSLKACTDFVRRHEDEVLYGIRPTEERFAHYVTGPVLAQRLGVSRFIVRRWANKGMPHSVAENGAYLYDPAACMAWAKGRREHV